MAQTAAKLQQRQQQTPPPQNALTTLQPPRIPLPATITEAYGVDEFKWRTLLDTVFPAAKTIGAVQMALDYCKSRNLDIMKKPVHIVPIYSTALKRSIETVWPGIAEHRTTAMRTGSYAGMDAPEFGPKIKKAFKGKKPKGDGPDQEWESVEVEVEFPEWCRITLWRFVQGQRVPFPGPRVEWLEAYQRASRFSELPNDMWQKRATGQLEKCAEAAALRRAFPEELGDEWTAEEAGQIERVHNMQDVTDHGVVTTTPAQEPRREDPKYQQPSAGASDRPGDGQAGEQAAATPTATSAPPGPVTDVEDQNEKPATKVEFETFETARAFFDFSDTWLVDPSRTEAEILQWEEFYREKIKEMAEHKFPRIREAIAQTLSDYSAALNRVRGQQ